MIDPEKRGAIYLLHKEGMGIRDISETMNVCRKTVSEIIDQKGIMPDTKRADKIEIDPELLFRLYNECCGRAQRVHEKLTEEEGVVIGYSTLTRMLREFDFRGKKKKRCSHVPDEPGAEMQHDTSIYILKIGDKKVRVIGSLLYLRYCKMRYLKFYRSFNRFTMKCFFHEALSFFRYAAPVCIIDNTNLARLRGTGKNAIIAPEMEKFAKQYGFTFICHKIGHANRKAGNERSFYTVETNFFPGRTFKSLEDLNRQANEWATIRMPNRPVAKSHLIPAKAFEYEKPYLVKLPPYVPAPYLIHKRGTDQYGYTPLDGNFYWVPGTSRDSVMLLQYSYKLKIYQKRKLLAEYELPPDGVKNEAFSPKGMPKPPHKPKYRKKPTAEEEKKLRAMDEEVDAYLNFALKLKSSKEKHRFIRQLFGLSKKIIPSLFIKTIKRVLKYHITDTKTVERIALLQIRDCDYEIPYIEIDEEFQQRQAYLEGRLTDEADLSVYEKMLEKDDNDG
jgi:transposase